MITWAVTPALVGLCLVGVLVVVHRRLPPRSAAMALTAVATATAASVLLSLVLLVIGVLRGWPWLADRMSWCPTLLPAHDAVAVPVGLAAAAALLISLPAGGRAWYGYRRSMVDDDAGAGVHIVDDPSPMAVALAGGQGLVLITTGLLAILDRRERAAVLAHERAHLDHHHHRYLAAGDVAAAAVPLLRPLAIRIRFATERWADETAAAVLGDRQLVAHAIGRVALAATDHANASHLGGASVLDRIDALLRPPRRCPSAELVAGLAAGLAVAGLAGTGWQAHHLLEFAFHACQVS